MGNYFYEAMAEYGDVARCDEHTLCDKFLSVFVAADADGLANIQKNEQLGVFLINSVARIAMKLDMKDIRATNVIIDEKEQSEQEKLEKEANIEEAKEDIDEEQLKSDAAKVELDDEGAPDLMNM